MILKIHILLIVLYPHQTNHCKWLHKIHVTYLLLLFFLYTLRKHTCRIRIANKFIQVLFKLNRDITACLWGLQKCLETIEQETGLHVDIHAQMASPKTLTMQYMVLFSHRTLQLPVEKQKSVSLKAISLLCLDLVCFALKKKKMKPEMLAQSYNMSYHLYCCPRNMSWQCANLPHFFGVWCMSLGEQT